MVQGTAAASAAVGGNTSGIVNTQHFPVLRDGIIQASLSVAAAPAAAAASAPSAAASAPAAAAPASAAAAGVGSIVGALTQSILLNQVRKQVCTIVHELCTRRLITPHTPYYGIHYVHNSRCGPP